MPRAASRACRRTRSASCSVCPGEERAASTPKIAAMTRLIPSRMSVAGMASNAQPQCLPSGDLRQCQDGERKDRGRSTPKAARRP